MSKPPNKEYFAELFNEFLKIKLYGVLNHFIENIPEANE
jgi:hypothetical protein